MKYTLSILVENHAGVLSKISGLFSRRGYNIDTLAVGSTEKQGISRITIVADGDEYLLEQIEKQLNKLIPVIKVKRLPEGEFISRELSLVKVNCTASQRAELISIAQVLEAKIVDLSVDYLIFEFCNTKDKTDTFLNLLKPYGIKEIVKAGTVAIEKGNSNIK